MMVRVFLSVVAMLYAACAIAQAPPPPTPSSTTVSAPTPGLSPQLAEASKLIGEGRFAPALVTIDSVLATDARNPQARFLRGVALNGQGQTNEAIAIFQELTQDYPELPEPHNNLAVIWAQQGKYDMARTALEIALSTRPDYAIAHENLGDVYARLAGAEYTRAVALDKANKSAQSKLKMVRELYAVAPSTTVPKPPEVIIAPLEAPTGPGLN
jgi:tetratricopeptide (TPR) repeat protein